MASPPFSHAGPSYYQSPAHAQYASYGPVPPPNVYYMQHTHPGQSMQPERPGLNGVSRGGYNPHRGGGPAFQSFPPTQYIHPQNPMQSPPVSSYFHPQKYPPHPQQVPYSPPYPPQNGAYGSAWLSHTLSPLPKQLSMLPSLLPDSPPTQEQHAPSPSLSPVPAADDAPPSPSVRSPQFHSQSMQQPSAVEHTDWVIWSRRPRDPSSAPGIIISHRAYPSDNIIQRAVKLPTPPASPSIPKQVAPNAAQVAPNAAQVAPNAAQVALNAAQVALNAAQVALNAAQVAPNAAHDVPESSPERPEVPSSSATGSTSPMPDTPTPGTPLSTNTSVSLAAPSAADPEKTTALSAAEPLAVVPPAVAAPKKSWASLLQPADAASPSSAAKSRLPVSSVVGFSIPAASMPNGSPAVAAPPALLHLLTTGPLLGPSLPIRPRGLVNTGNLCFANAVLQALVYCPPFFRLFRALARHLPAPVVGQHASPLVDATVRFLAEFDVLSKGKSRADEEFEAIDSFIPSYVYDAMREKKRFANMVGGHQEDAEEFLGFFLDTLEEELLALSTALAPPPVAAPVEQPPAPAPDDLWLEVGKRNRSVVTRTAGSGDSPITRIFGGKFRSTLRAPRQRDSVTVEDWRSLRLDIQREDVHSIKDALRYLSHPEAVQITSPTRPGVVIDATQQVLIETLPPILILHLKRFHYDTAVNDVVKLGKQVAFGPELEIGPDLVTPTQRTAHPAKYQLFGVLYHHGQSASGGHYTLDVLHSDRDFSDRPRATWIRIDDELVSDIRPEDVFNGLDRDDRCPYLLFYRKISSGGPSRS